MNVLRPMIVWLFVLACLASALPSTVLAAQGTQQAPKLLNLFLNYFISDEDPAKLAQWDIVVLDMDQQARFPEKLREIKRRNPHTKLLAYVSASEIGLARGNDLPSFPGRQLVDALPEAWFLHRADGARISWWPGNAILNASHEAPLVNGQRWNQFLGPFIRDRILSSGLWDGIFLDSAYGEITPFAGTDVDLNSDGHNDPPRQNDAAYRAGMRDLIRNVRAAVGSQVLIMNNSSAAYADVTNGVLFENFPRDGWAWPFAELRRSLTQNVSPKISAVNTNTNNEETPANYRLMRYGLASALVADSYFSFDAGDRGHHRTWWYDEYGAALGDAVGKAQVVRGPKVGAYPALWSRAYSGGLALVNSTARAETVSLPGEFERLHGTQDPVANDGAILDRVVVPPQDGVILMRHAGAQAIHGSAFTNGTFFQVYNAQGIRTRNGFFASRDDVPGGARVMMSDVDQDGLDDVIFTQDGQLTVRWGKGGAPLVMRPFGSGYHGDITFAVGQTNHDPALEIVMTPATGHTATVVIADTHGRILRSWLAYRPEFTGGASVAFGDVDGDDRREIVTGPGRGGGPHVRVFRTDGQLWAGGFFAFDTLEQGGVRVAIGDVDGDGRAEIIVGSGPGSVPRVRVYDREYRLRSEMVLGSVPSPIGVEPVVTDLDGDGKAEILIPSSPF